MSLFFSCVHFVIVVIFKKQFMIFVEKHPHKAESPTLTGQIPDFAMLGRSREMATFSA